MSTVEMPDIPAFLDRRKPKPIVYSYTMLDAYGKCPHQAYRRYIKKDQKYVESAAMKWGNEAHSALEYRLGGKPLPPEMQQWEPLIAAFDGRGAKAEQKLGITKHATACDFFGEAVWFRGKIDVTIIEGTVGLIADHKTGNSNYETPFELETNALLLHAKHPELKSIFGFYIWLKDLKVGKVYDLSDTNGTWQKVNKTIAEIELNQTWEKRKSGLCGYCSVSDCEHHFVARQA